LTIRGPYKQRLNLTAANRIIQNQSINIIGVGNFFEYNQNTVYLKVNSPEVKAIWHKKGLNYNPHITIYDGPTRIIAESIFILLSKYDIKITFKSSELYPLIVSKGQSDLDLALIIDETLLRRFSNYNLTLDNIRNLSDEERLGLLTNFVSYLPSIISSFNSNK
jgi:hypothetical protein